MNRGFFLNLPQPLWVEVARRLAKKGVVEPVYWTSNESSAELVRQAFPDAVFHLRLQAMRGLPAPAFADLPLDPLDKEILERFAFAESIALRMMERMDIGDSFSYRERVRLFHQLLRYWLTVTRRLKPDVAIFYSSPHIVYDFVLYSVCRNLGVRTILLKHTGIPEWKYFAESVEGGSPGLLEHYRRSLEPVRREGVSLTDRNELFLRRILGSYEDAKPDYMNEQERKSAELSLTNQARQLLRPSLYRRHAARLTNGVRKSVTAALSRKPANTLLKLRSHDVAEWPTVAQFTRLKFGSQLRLRRLKHHYARLTAPVDLEAPFVYCALHMQPERTTSPEAGPFVHQELMVELLAANLPAGWRLFVKEHPSQFQSEMLIDSSLAQSRSIAFYDRLAATPGVTLVPLAHPPFELIDRARAVATATGTVAWEAVVRGKPALTFGYPWFMGCEGIFRTLTGADVARAFDTISAGYRVDHEKVRRFVSAIEQVGFEASLRHPDEQPSEEEEAELVEVCERELGAMFERTRERSGVA